MAHPTPTPTKIHISSNAPDGTSTFLPSGPAPSQPHGSSSTLTYLYSTSGPLPLDLSQNADLDHHLVTASSSPLPLFPGESGSAFFILDVSPNPDGREGMMHRTKTIDYIYVLDGEIELSLHVGTGEGAKEEKRVIRKGEVVVLRGSYHKSKNMSKDQGARLLVFCAGGKGAVEGVGGVEVSK